jgi:hypothetical protein
MAIVDSRCTKCGTFLFWRTQVTDHKCDRYVVVDEQYNGPEGTAYHAVDAEDAAEKYARDFNESGDYDLMDDSRIVTVGDRSFRISAEASIHYSVEEVEDE